MHTEDWKQHTDTHWMTKKGLSEADICAKYITPELIKAGWDETQIRREVYFTKGRIIVRGKLVTRGKAKRADYVLYYQTIPIALIEAKDNDHAIGDGMQQALDYAKTLVIPFVFSSNGDGFLFHDKTGLSTHSKTIERNDGTFTELATAFDKTRRLKMFFC